MITADQILQLVNNYLDNMPYDRQPASLYAPIRYVLSMGGFLCNKFEIWNNLCIFAHKLREKNN